MTFCCTQFLDYVVSAFVACEFSFAHLFLFFWGFATKTYRYIFKDFSEFICIHIRVYALEGTS